MDVVCSIKVKGLNMLSTVQQYGNLPYQHLHQESNSRGVIVSYITKQQNDRLDET